MSRVEIVRQRRQMIRQAPGFRAWRSQASAEGFFMAGADIYPAA